VTRSFGITFDYLCPFARNANEHVTAGLRDGADWEVSFVPYSLAQGHVDEGEPAVWDRDDRDTVSGILALQVGVTVRDEHPEAFLDVHDALFAARHDDGRDIKDPAVLRDVLSGAGLDADAVLEQAREGRAPKTLRTEHDAAVDQHGVWGVPTFIAGGRAVFVRLLDRPDGDGDRAQRRIAAVLDLVESELELHEFKQTDLPI
jgi:xanthine/CO dehydrogenase XdhC/CoxF family maturation factor